MTFESLLAPLSPPLWEDPSCGHSVCPGCCLGMDGWMDGWKERRDLGLKILSESRVRVIMNHTALPATCLSPGEEDQHWLHLGHFGGGRFM